METRSNDRLTRTECDCQPWTPLAVSVSSISDGHARLLPVDTFWPGARGAPERPRIIKTPRPAIAWLFDDIESVAIVRWTDIRRTAVESDHPLMDRLPLPLIPHLDTESVLRNIDSRVRRVIEAIRVDPGRIERRDRRAGLDTSIAPYYISSSPVDSERSSGGLLNKRYALTRSDGLASIMFWCRGDVSHMGVNYIR
jgi:hypothetical protein